MKLQLYSDLHLEQGYFFIPPETDADVIILAGDIAVGAAGLEYAASLIRLHQKPVIYVPGNHEFYHHDLHSLRHEMQSIARKEPQLHLLDNATLILGNVRFIGSTLWTDYQLNERFGQSANMAFIERFLNDHRFIHIGENKFSTMDALALHQQAKRYLTAELSKPFDGKTVVVTHHAPSLDCHHPGFTLDNMAAAFVTDCDALLSHANVWCYGHTHANVDTVINGCRVVSNQKGYLREQLPAAFQKSLVITV